MPNVTLRDVYVAELQDLFDAERQILEALPEMADAATSSELRNAFSEHLEQTKVQLQRVELLLRKLDVRATGHTCDAVRALIADGRRRIADTERGDVLDAALIGAAQRIEHFEIAAYGCARTYARTLGSGEAADLLQQSLDEEGKTDHRLSRIAERGINQAAGEDASTEARRQRTRLRYVPAGELREFSYREYRVRNAQREDLGSLDGLVIDARTRRPIYFVIDSGGWFVGQRYLVPIGLLQADEESKTLRTNLDRETIHRYPPFNPATFADTHGDVPPAYDLSPDYQPPTWLMTGVWMTDGSGFAAVPPRAQSDMARGESPAATAAPPAPGGPDVYPENELMMARGEPDDRKPADKPAAEAPRDDEPRIERYRER
jgi:ferritin-like metal-binding protein YciE